MKEQMIEFMKENGIAVLAEADRKTNVVHIEKTGSLESWDLFQQLVLHTDVDVLCDSTRSKFPFQTWGQGNTVCLISWINENKAVALFFDCELTGEAFPSYIRMLDQKVRQLY